MTISAIDGGLWANYVKPRLGPYGRFKRVENSIGESGTPDCHYTIKGWGYVRPASGWLELKQADLPDRVTTPVRIKSLKLKQVEWHEDEHAVGGRVHTLVRLGPFFVLVDAPVLRAVYEKTLLLPELKAKARYYSDRFNPSEIIRCLRSALTLTKT